jgi:hypothetical protein
LRSRIDRKEAFVIPSALFMARGICLSAAKIKADFSLRGMTNSYFARGINSAAGGFTPYIAAKLF